MSSFVESTKLGHFANHDIHRIKLFMTYVSLLVNDVFVFTV